MASGRFVTATTMPGHAIGTARIAAATLGWKMVLLDGVAKTPSPRSWVRLAKKIQTMLSVSIRTALAVVWPTEDVEQYAKSKIPLFVENAVVGDLAKCTWHGESQSLSRENPVPWEIIMTSR